MSFLSNLEWRRAIKHFVPPTESHPAPDISGILLAARSAPSSFGLQPYKILVVTDPETKALLSPVCFHQPQITECSHLLIFCARNDLEERFREFVRHTGIPAEYQSIIQETLSTLSHPIHWAKHQTYISLGFALAAAAESRIACCPMEGFNPDGISSILDISHTLVPTVLLAVGNHDASSELPPRFRFPASDLVQYISQTRTVPVGAPKSRYRHVTPVRKRVDKK